MARNRDGVSVMNVRDMKKVGGMKLPKGRGKDKHFTESEATIRRYRGRRGVRARRRLYRIGARKAVGTYQQPSGGTTTNS